MKPGDDMENSSEELLKRTVAIGIKNQHQFRPEPLFKLAGKGHYQSDTVKDVEAAKRNQQKRERSMKLRKLTRDHIEKSDTENNPTASEMLVAIDEADASPLNRT